MLCVVLLPKPPKLLFLAGESRKPKTVPANRAQRIERNAVLFLIAMTLLSDYFPATDRPSTRISGAPRTVTPEG